MAHQSSPIIELTPAERQLRDLLVDVAASINTSGLVSEPVILRWAGGWVRDKLLGNPSNDIDVGINTMTGVSFARHARDVCDRPEIQKKHNIQKKDIGNLYNVAANPEKSKHLETAMVRMFGLDLDFVNLRKETYAEDSRNPQMEFGTPEEDAERRDATINALFYNLHTGKVEDFTGGLPDMEKKIIRTPLEPLKTFKDDPLRVLRLVRFASRLQFKIDDETRRFMNDEQVLHALTVKISRERVGVELEKMLRGKHPLDSLVLIDEIGLYQAIFTDPASPSPSPPDISRWPVAYRCLHELLSNETPGSIGETLVRSKEAAYYAWCLAAVTPWMPIEPSPQPRRKANALPPAGVIAREGFKAPNKVTDIIAAAYRNRPHIMEFKLAVRDDRPIMQERDTIGMAIRQWDTPSGTWRLQVLGALLVDAIESLETWQVPGTDAQHQFLREWQALLDHLAELDLCEAPSLKPLVDGVRLSSALGVKPGRWTGHALKVCIAWQLRHPGATDPTGAIEEVRQRREELEIPS